MYISKLTSNNIIGDLMIINDSRINKKIKDNSIDKNNKQKSLLSFVFGGFVGFLGELIYVFYYNVLQLEIDTSMKPLKPMEDGILKGVIQAKYATVPVLLLASLTEF